MKNLREIWELWADHQIQSEMDLMRVELKRREIARKEAFANLPPEEKRLRIQAARRRNGTDSETREMHRKMQDGMAKGL